MKGATLLFLACFVGLAISGAALCTTTKTRGGAGKKKWLSRGGASFHSIMIQRGGAVLSSKSVKGKGTRTRTYHKTGWVARIFGRAKEFIRAYFESLVDPSFESNLSTPTMTLAESAKRRKARGGRRFGSLDSLPPEPKG